MTDSIILPPNSKAIVLGKGKHTIVDEWMYEDLNRFKWIVNDVNYAIRYLRKDNKSKYISLSRFIMKPEKYQVVDHINGNTLDNRLCNLRICTHAQNLKNRKPHKNRPFKGVYRITRKNKYKPDTVYYTATITNDRKSYFLGSYETSEEAAVAYNEASLYLHGEYGRQNCIPMDSIISAAVDLINKCLTNGKIYNKPTQDAVNSLFSVYQKINAEMQK